MEKPFIAEFEKMDLSPLQDGMFIVAVSTGGREEPKILASTIHGPYSFLEMVEEVGIMWATHQHHAKVFPLEKDRRKRATILDKNTVDYIEAHYEDILLRGMLQGAFSGEEYTCKAGTVAPLVKVEKLDGEQ